MVKLFFGIENPIGKSLKNHRRISLPGSDVIPAPLYSNY